MKSKISIILFFVLPFVICGRQVPLTFIKEVEEINILAKNGTEINEVLLLKEDGLLGEGHYGFAYEGTIIEENRPVAIKFVKEQHSLSCEREIDMYSYLKAFKNESVEEYGIPVVYYYSRWENYILMAITKFDKDLIDIANENPSFGENPLDILILLRDFVFQSKYLHSHGIRHDDIKPENIMLRGHRYFLIDFNLSSKMMKDNRGYTIEYLCKRFKTGKNRRAIDDYESFLYTISRVMRKKWFGPELDNKSRKNRLANNGLENIIKAFADEVFTDNPSKAFPDYNKLEKKISSEIEGIISKCPSNYSWIRNEAARKIKAIAEPKYFNFHNFDYPPLVRLPPLGSTEQPVLATHASTSTTGSFRESIFRQKKKY